MEKHFLIITTFGFGLLFAALASREVRIILDRSGA